MTQQIEISKIKVGKRFRKNIGDIMSLKNSIEEVDLLHPVVIDEHDNLVAGFRRIKACEQLGWQQIPYTRISIDDTQIGEFHENSVRKDFTVKEVVDIKKYVEGTRIGHRPEKGGKLPPLGTGKTRDIVSEITGYSPRQINKMETIVKAVEKKPEFAHFLEDIDNGKKSINTTHTLVTKEERNLPKIPLPKTISDVFYCDVPIGFKDKGGRGAAEKHYPTMPAEEIIKDFKTLAAADNAIIFFWMSPSIAYDEIPIDYKYAADSALKIQVQTPIYKAILDSAGFKIKSEFVWIKDKWGMGSYNRNQHENLFFAIKGKMPTPAKLFSSVIESIRTSHSEKPKLHNMIMEMYPKRNYQELYAREKVPGWKIHGNQIKTRTIFNCIFCGTVCKETGFENHLSKYHKSQFKKSDHKNSQDFFKAKEMQI